jgi:RNA recognition motif-containing protein
MVNIYVGNLAWGCTNDDLMQLFSQHGTVARAQVILDRETGRSRGFGFVEMPNEAEAKVAVEALNNFNFQGRPLTVNEARPREPRPGGGGGGGGYGGGGVGRGYGGGGGGGYGGGGGGGGYGNRGGRY